MYVLRKLCRTILALFKYKELHSQNGINGIFEIVYGTFLLSGMILVRTSVERMTYSHSLWQQCVYMRKTSVELHLPWHCEKKKHMLPQI